jgi:hypothetical protein
MPLVERDRIMRELLLRVVRRLELEASDGDIMGKEDT